MRGRIYSLPSAHYFLPSFPCTLSSSHQGPFVPAQVVPVWSVTVTYELFSCAFLTRFTPCGTQYVPESRQSTRLFLQSSNWFPPPTPSHAGECVPLLVPGGDTLACGKGNGGVPIPTRGQTLWHSRYICTLWYALYSPVLKYASHLFENLFFV